MALSPKQIVKELDKYIVGQPEAKRAVAIALRNRYRRSQLSPELRDEITPKNIILKGPTGVGKTEIARRLAKLVKAPFVKVEATKYTEVGYVGKDVEGMVKDLVEVSYRLVKEEKMAEVSAKATARADRKILNLLKELKRVDQGETPDSVFEANLKESYKKGVFDETIVEMDVSETPVGMDIMAAGSSGISIGSVFGDLFPKKKKKRKLTVKEARQILIAEESDKLIDNDTVSSEALKRAENEGIIFIDEIDKIAAKGNAGGADVSREGVQRDILPIVEGCTVMTKYGPVKTDFMLFVAAGAFHVASVDDLIPELQGRFPIYVELHSLTKEDFIQILTLTENSITMQYQVLLAVDNIDLKFTKDAIERIAEIAVDMNATSEDIGARRLHTVMEDLLEEISFEAGGGDYPVIPVEVNKAYVDQHLASVTETRDLKQFVL